jgi:hypothetical protein
LSYEHQLLERKSFFRELGLQKKKSESFFSPSKRKSCRAAVSRLEEQGVESVQDKGLDDIFEEAAQHIYNLMKSDSFFRFKAIHNVA